MRTYPTIISLFLAALGCSSPTDDGGRDPRLQGFWVDSIGGVGMGLGRPFDWIEMRYSWTYPFGYPVFEDDSLGLAVADFRIGCVNKKGEAFSEKGKAFSEIAWVHYRRADSSVISVGAAAFPPSEGMACTLLGEDQVVFEFPQTTEVITADLSLGEDGCAYLRMRLPGGGTVGAGHHYAGEPIPGYVTFLEPMPYAFLRSRGCFY